MNIITILSRAHLLKCNIVVNNNRQDLSFPNPSSSPAIQDFIKPSPLFPSVAIWALRLNLFPRSLGSHGTRLGTKAGQKLALSRELCYLGRERRASQKAKKRGAWR